MTELLSKTESEGGPSVDDVCSVIFERDEAGEPIVTYWGRLCATPFTRMCMSANFKLTSLFVEYLVKHRRQETLNTVLIDHNLSALHIAAYFGRSETVELLLNAGSDLRLVDVYGASPLFIACHNGHAAVVLLLTGKGANLNKAKTDGATPLYAACCNGHDAVVMLLTDKGANVNQA